MRTGFIWLGVLSSDVLLLTRVTRNAGKHPAPAGLPEPVQCPIMWLVSRRPLEDSVLQIRSGEMQK